MGGGTGAPHTCLWGISHQTAPLQVREAWTLNAEEKPAALRALREQIGGEIVALGTCNRMEFYFCAPAVPALSTVSELLRAIKGAEKTVDASACYFREGAAAVAHLFSVASGLDSQILGETEIQGQVREDLALARAAGTCASELGRLFEHALKVGKRVRSETRLSEGVLSAGQAGVLLAGKVLGDLSQAEVLLIGTGEIGTLTARALIAHGARRLRVTSRTEGNARRLAGELGAEVIPFEKAGEAIAASDLVISSTSAPGHLFDRGKLAELLRPRSDRAIVLIDLAVPRDFDPAVASIDNVFLHDLDDLEAVLAQSWSQRAGEIPRCESIVEEECRKFMARQSFRREIEPLVGRLVEAAEAWRRDEVSREVGGLAPEARQAVDEITHRLIRRVLFLSVNRLKELRDRGLLSPEEMELLREIFEVESDGDTSRGNAR